MQTDDKYNGWTNRETWAAHLWLTSDEDVYSWARGKDAEFLKEHFMLVSGTDQVTGYYFHALRDSGSLWRVNWDEVAKALIGDAK